MSDIDFSNFPLLLAATLQFNLHAQFVVSLPKEMEEIFSRIRDLYNQGGETAFTKVGQREKHNNADYFFNLLQMGIHNGLAASYYNLQTFTRYSQEIREQAEAIIKPFKPVQPITVGFTVDKLVFEYEHFTLHSRILLDRLNWFLNYYFMTDTRNLYRLYKDIKGRYPHDIIARRVLAIIDNHRTYLDTQISTDKANRRTERDHLAHREEIQFTFLNINILPDGSVKPILFTKNDPFGSEAETLLEYRFRSLSTFVIEIINAFFGF